MKTLLTTTALVLAMAAGAYAGQLSAGPIFSFGAASGYCWYINLGAVNITPTSQLMYSFTSNSPIPTTDYCTTGNPVVPGQSCYIQPTTTGYNVLSCKVVFSDKVVAMRGSLELFDGGGNFVSQVELR